MGLTLETERLVLTEAAEDDVDGLLQVALSNPEFTGDHEGDDARRTFPGLLIESPHPERW